VSDFKDFGWGSAPDPAGGAYSAPPDPLAGFKGPTSKGREGRGKGWEEGGKEGEGKGRGRGRGDLLQGLRGDRRPCSCVQSVDKRYFIFMLVLICHRMHYVLYQQRFFI